MGPIYFVFGFGLCLLIQSNAGQLIPHQELQTVTSCDLKTTIDVSCGSSEVIAIHSLYFYYHPGCDSICCGYDSSHFSSGADGSLVSEVRRGCSGRNTCSLGQLDGVRDFEGASTQYPSYVVIKYYCLPDCVAPPNVTGATVTTSSDNLESSFATYACEEGYTHTSGDLQRTCRSDSTWSGTLPFCTPDCGAPPNVTGATVITSSGNLESSVATYACEEGYTHTSGDLQRTCRSENVWSGALPICTPDCGAPPNVTGATVTTSSGNLESSIATYVCEAGYMHTSGDLQRTCRYDSTWSGTLPICTPDCGAPPNITGATVTTSSGNLETSIAIYVCKEGYTHTSADLERTCRSDSTWSGALPICTPACGNPPDSIGAEVTTSAGTLENSVATYVCQVGFAHTSGNLQRTCGSDSNWNGTLPTCTPDCGNPPDSMGAEFTTSAGSLENSVATYVCQDGFTYTSGNLQRTCGPDSKWNGTLPTCTPGCESTFLIGNGKLSSDVTNVGAFANVTCDTGFDASATRIECLSSGEWEAATCIIKDCGNPQNIKYGEIILLKAGKTTYNSSAKVTCKEGYNAMKQVVKCDKTGSWESSLCKRKEENLQLTDDGGSSSAALIVVLVLLVVGIIAVAVFLFWKFRKRFGLTIGPIGNERISFKNEEVIPIPEDQGYQNSNISFMNEGDVANEQQCEDSNASSKNEDILQDIPLVQQNNDIKNDDSDPENQKHKDSEIALMTGDTDVMQKKQQCKDSNFAVEPEENKCQESAVDVKTDEALPEEQKYEGPHVAVKTDEVPPEKHSSQELNVAAITDVSLLEKQPSQELNVAAKTDESLLEKESSQDLNVATDNEEKEKLVQS